MDKKYILCAFFFFLLSVAALPVAAQKKQVIKKQVETGFVPDSTQQLVPDQSETIKMFDRKGNILEEQNNRIFEGHALNYVKKNIYNERGMIDTSLVYNDNKLTEKLVYKFDAKGKQSEIHEYTGGGTPSFTTKDLYDKAGNMTRVEMYDPQNKLYNFKTYKYDKAKNLIDESGSEQGEPRYHWTYTYNSNNLLTVRKDLSGQEVLLRIHYYQYGDDNRLVREDVKDAAGVLQRVVKYTYEFY